VCVSTGGDSDSEHAEAHDQQQSVGCADADIALVSTVGDVVTRLRALSITVAHVRQSAARDCVRSKRQFRRERDELAVLVGRLKTQQEDISTCRALVCAFIFANYALVQLGLIAFLCMFVIPIDSRTSLGSGH